MRASATLRSTTKASSRATCAGKTRAAGTAASPFTRPRARFTSSSRADESDRFVARLHLTADLGFEKGALAPPQLRAGLAARDLRDLVAGKQRLRGEVRKIERVVAAERAKQRRQLAGDPFAGVVERD